MLPNFKLHLKIKFLSQPVALNHTIGDIQVLTVNRSLPGINPKSFLSQPVYQIIFDLPFFHGGGIFIVLILFKWDKKSGSHIQKYFNYKV